LFFGLPSTIYPIKVTKTGEIMKKCWSLFIPLSLMSLNFLGYILYAQPVWHPKGELLNPVATRTITARILADVYLLSNPMNDPNELIQYIQDKPEYFRQNGAVTVAARNLGNWILSNNIRSFEEDCLEKIENQLQKENFSKEYASDLLSEIKKSKFDCNSIGKELIWLSKLLPELSKGNLKEYLNTGTEIRQQLRMVIPLYQVMHNSDPEIAELILKDKNCYHQKMADQIQLLALIAQENQ
jgi:hypothetical protein